MEQRRHGRTGMMVSVLGYGCVAVGGLMVRGAPAEQERSIAHAIESGINYFDTAPAYGNGESERNLGRVLKTLRGATELLVGTKVRIPPDRRDRIGETVAASIEDSLRRLGRDSVDLFQLHNPISEMPKPTELTPDAVLGEVVPAFERLRQQGKTRFLGITALGQPAALRRVIGARVFDTAQVAYNMLNPSPVAPLPPGSPAHDFEGLMRDAAAADVGVIGIRVLAGGALSGEEARHPIAQAEVAPIGSGPDYRADVAQARRLRPLIVEGHAADLVEAALRFAIAAPQMGTVLVGTATLGQLEHALAAVAKGPLSAAALGRLAELQRGGLAA
jgi:L-galactose dehydrogenase/L-glyceraldehyde 3-phosphate reductase